MPGRGIDPHRGAYFSFGESLRFFGLAPDSAFVLDFPSFISSCGLGGMRTIAAMMAAASGGISLVESFDISRPFPVMTEELYHAELGSFILWYARIENKTHSLFRHCTGMPEDVARTISGGMRFSDVIGLIKRLAKARGFDSRTLLEMERIFTQLADITKLRDSLIHRGGEYIEGSIWSTNIAIAKAKEDIEFLKLKISDITAAKQDCSRIFVRLDLIISPKNQLDDPAYMKWMFAPWLYRHRPPTTPNRASQPKRQSRGHRPRASRALPPRQNE